MEEKGPGHALGHVADDGGAGHDGLAAFWEVAVDGLLFYSSDESYSIVGGKMSMLMGLLVLRVL